MPAISELTEEQWKEVETLAVAGMSYEEIGQKYDMEPVTIRVRAHRKKWAVPSRVQRLQKMLREKGLIQTKPTDLVGNETEGNVALKMAESLTEIGERNALRVAVYTENKLREAIEGDLLPAPQNWKDFSAANRTNADATGRNKPQIAIQTNVWGDGWSGQGAVPVEAEDADAP